MNMKKIRIVSVTPRNQMEFWHQTLLGQSLSLFPKEAGIEISVFANNAGKQRKGLGELYNTFLHPKFAGELLLFVHDDVYIHDWHLAQRLYDAFDKFDLVGLAGNSQPDFNEPSWALAWNREKYPSGRQPRKFFTGAVAHFVHGRTQISAYGSTPQACVLLDGLFLAVNTENILKAGIKFDPQFQFHFYDLDFCRHCHEKGLKIGTWPIAVTHGSHGAFNSPEWKATRDLYLDKWCESSEMSID